jgi:hypothetical protein
MLAVTLGTTISFVVLPLAGSVSLFLFVTMMGAAIYAAFAGDGERRPTARPLARPLAVGLRSALCVLGGAGLWVLLGPLSLTIVFLLAVSSPWVVGWVLRRREAPPAVPERPDPRVGRAPDRATDPAPDHDDRLRAEPWMLEPPRSMPDDALCLAWRKSYAALEQRLSMQARAQVVQRRQELLDELERRNARGFSAWLGSGARAAGDPSRFFRSDDRRQHDRG